MCAFLYACIYIIFLYRKIPNKNLGLFEVRMHFMVGLSKYTGSIHALSMFIHHPNYTSTQNPKFKHWGYIWGSLYSERYLGKFKEVYIWVGLILGELTFRSLRYMSKYMPLVCIYGTYICLLKYIYIYVQGSCRSLNSLKNC